MRELRHDAVLVRVLAARQDRDCGRMFRWRGPAGAYVRRLRCQAKNVGIVAIQIAGVDRMRLMRPHLKFDQTQSS